MIAPSSDHPYHPSLRLLIFLVLLGIGAAGPTTAQEPESEAPPQSPATPPKAPVIVEEVTREPAPPIGELLATLTESSDVQEKIRAAQGLAEPERRGEAANPDRRHERARALPVLLAALDDESPWVRQAAVEALGFYGADAVPALDEVIGALEDPHPSVRAEAVWALGKIGPPDEVALPKLRDALLDDDPWVVTKALSALETFGPSALVARDDIVRLADHGDAQVRAAVASLLGELESDDASVASELRNVLEALRDDSEDWVARRAAMSLEDLDIRSTQRQGRRESLLHQAARQGHLPRVRALLDAGHAPDSEAAWGRTPLMTAAEAGRAAVVGALLDAGADPDQRNWSGQHALIGAASRCKVEALRVLVERGASLDQRDGDGETALSRALDRQCTAGVELLRAAGARTGTPLLVEALRRGDTEGIARGLEQPRSFYARDGQGKAALHWAAITGHLDAIRTLVAAGQPLDLRDERNSTPLMLAAEAGQAESVDLLLELGADLEARDRYDRTALRYALRGREKELVGELLDRGADPWVQDKGGELAWNDALGSEDPALQDLIEEAGGRVDPPAHPTTLLAARVVHETPGVLVLDVDYYDDGTVPNLWVGALTQLEGFSTGHWSYKPGRVRPGTHCARVLVGVNSSAPETYTSDDVVVELYVSGGAVIRQLTLDHPKTWTRTAEPIDAYGTECAPD